MNDNRQAGFIQRGFDLWRLVTRALDALQPLAALLARLHMAQVFFMSGLTKLRDWETTVALFIDEHKVPLLSSTAAVFMGTPLARWCCRCCWYAGWAAGFVRWACSW